MVIGLIGPLKDSRAHPATQFARPNLTGARADLD
jgi:hypothetical protein